MTAQISALELSSLLCSRLCHDLLSPIGALNNGIELLADEKDPAMRERCIELLTESARTSAHKLRYFRLAMGAAGGFDDLIDLSEARQLISEQVHHNSRLELNWQAGEGQLPKPAVKILLNFAMIAMEALVRGGTLDIAAQDDGKISEIVVRGDGPKIAFDDVIRKALLGELSPAEMTPRTASAHVLHMIAQQCDGQIQIARDDAQIVMGAMLPR